MARLKCISENCGREFVQSPSSKSLRCPPCRGARDRARQEEADRVDPVRQAFTLGRFQDLSGLLYGGPDYD